ncbi:hypothetical protein HMPREF9453_01028 [Dialister succinatiphilus YIT 11850]|uniref:Uncharacterized protein n=1 Tax=Dialister succinatiphilus YIT 11850 TaxID=742743 RepID=H1D090_9FIRM|nr:hypothetical protein HMPREF9453_01028 [Dialister succinatiphilus YIT 11850]
MRSFLLSRRFLKDRRLPEGKGGPFGAPSALSVYIVLLKKGVSQWFGMGPLCGPGSKGGGGGFAAGCVEGLWKKVLKMDRPLAGGFLSLTALRAEGCGLPLCGNAYKVSVTGLAFSVIWHDRHSADWFTALASPYPASTDFPLCRGQNKTPRNTLFINGSTVSTSYCAPACGGKVVAPATKGGISLARQGGWPVFRHPQGGCKGFFIRGRLL